MGVNVLAGLAEGVLDAILEREDDRERDPFAVALERYRSVGTPDEVSGVWRGSTRRAAGDLAATEVLKRLDRDLLAGIVRYASAEGPGEPATPEPVEDAGMPSSLAILGAARAMPSLELGADGTWHVAAAPVGAPGRPTDPRSRLAGSASRYPRQRPLPSGPGLGPIRHAPRGDPRRERPRPTRPTEDPTTRS